MRVVGRGGVWRPDVLSLAILHLPSSCLAFLASHFLPYLPCPYALSVSTPSQIPSFPFLPQHFFISTHYFSLSTLLVIVE